MLEFVSYVLKKTEDYRWAMEKLIAAINAIVIELPSVLVTDGEKAMLDPLQDHFSESRHIVRGRR